MQQVLHAQKFYLRNVPSVDKVGGPADGLTCIVTGPTRSLPRCSCLPPAYASHCTPAAPDGRAPRAAAASGGRRPPPWCGGGRTVSACCCTTWRGRPRGCLALFCWGGSACSTCFPMHHTQCGLARSRAGVSQPRTRRQAADGAAGGGRACGPHGRQNRGTRALSHGHLALTHAIQLAPRAHLVISMSSRGHLKFQVDRHAYGLPCTRQLCNQSGQLPAACGSQRMRVAGNEPRPGVAALGARVCGQLAAA
jgi:hypothetical protein